MEELGRVGPITTFSHELFESKASGDSMDQYAGGSSDEDGQNLTFRWK